MPLGMEKIHTVETAWKQSRNCGLWSLATFFFVIFQRALLYNFVLLGVGVSFKSTTSEACRKIVIFPFLLSFFICLYNDRN